MAPPPPSTTGSTVTATTSRVTQLHFASFGSNSTLHSVSTSEQSLPNAEERPTANPSSKTILSHFGGHNYECQYCKRTQISGVRYKYVGTTSVYSVCDACYSRLDSRKKLKCHARVMPWKTDAPAAPLRPKDLASINHLQYLLVKLGYLHISCSTSISKTEEAVASFRQQYHIYSNDMTEYDSKTARKLTLVVRQSRAVPAIKSFLSPFSIWSILLSNWLWEWHAFNNIVCSATSYPASAKNSQRA